MRQITLILLCSLACTPVALASVTLIGQLPASPSVSAPAKGVEAVIAKLDERIASLPPIAYSVRFNGWIEKDGKRSGGGWREVDGRRTGGGADPELDSWQHMIYVSGRSRSLDQWVGKPGDPPALMNGAVTVFDGTKSRQVLKPVHQTPAMGLIEGERTAIGGGGDPTAFRICEFLQLDMHQAYVPDPVLFGVNRHMTLPAWLSVTLQNTPDRPGGLPYQTRIVETTPERVVVEAPDPFSSQEMHRWVFDPCRGYLPVQHVITRYDAEGKEALKTIDHHVVQTQEVDGVHLPVESLVTWKGSDGSFGEEIYRISNLRPAEYDDSTFQVAFGENTTVHDRISGVAYHVLTGGAVQIVAAVAPGSAEPTFASESEITEAIRRNPPSPGFVLTAVLPPETHPEHSAEPPLPTVAQMPVASAGGYDPFRVAMIFVLVASASVFGYLIVRQVRAKRASPRQL